MTSTALFPFNDCVPLKNMSGGSAAKTFLVQEASGKVFVRKWASATAAPRLESQARWVSEHHHEFLCPRITSSNWVEDSLFYYDMEYIDSSNTLSQALTAGNNSDAAYLDLLLVCVRSLNEKASAHLQKPDPAQRTRYLHEKFYRNIEWLVAGNSAISALAQCKNLNIQGKTLAGLTEVLQRTSIKNVIDQVEQESLSSFGHGDLTLSNLLLANNAVYVIDPNPNFGLISPAQELSKILQSTLVSYESLNKISQVTIRDNSIEYQLPSSDALDGFTSRLLDSPEFKEHNRELLLFHLCVHLCRIFPYLPEEKPERKVLYFAEVIRLLNLIAA